MTNRTAAREFREARDFLLAHRHDHEGAVASFRWPRSERFNWATDWLDQIAPGNHNLALRTIGTDGETRTLTYEALTQRSHQVANWLAKRGLGKGGRLLLMLDNCPEVWETTIAAARLGAVVIPTYTSVSARELNDRIGRGKPTHVLTHAHLKDRFAEEALPGVAIERLCTGKATGPWHPYADADSEPATFTGATESDSQQPLFVYFTSGTTSSPKMVEHTQASYPIGHLTSMYWNGLRPNDIHVNVAKPGWAKHAWSSLFVPLNAEATVIAVDLPLGQARRLLDVVREEGATSLCAPPTMWRALLAEGLGEKPATLRELTSVGEALNPEVIKKVHDAWGLTVRDGYGQTEATAMIGNTPGSLVKLGSMGRPLPGYRIALIDPHTGQQGMDGEICVALDDRPVGVMSGYKSDEIRTAQAFSDGWYHTGDIAKVDEDGYITYLGRADDLFKVQGHRISPFELESVLIEHPMVSEAAVVPLKHPTGTVPKAFIVVKREVEPSRELARDILRHTIDQLAPHQQIQAVEFAALPKTVSGKIRRAELRVVAHSNGNGWHRDELLVEPGIPRSHGM